MIVTVHNMAIVCVCLCFRNSSKYLCYRRSFNSEQMWVGAKVVRHSMAWSELASQRKYWQLNEVRGEERHMWRKYKCSRKNVNPSHTVFTLWHPATWCVLRSFDRDLTGDTNLCMDANKHYVLMCTCLCMFVPLHFVALTTLQHNKLYCCNVVASCSPESHSTKGKSVYKHARLSHSFYDQLVT